MRDFCHLIPGGRQPYEGMRFAVLAWVVYLTNTTVRSPIHHFAPDGGSGTLAGADATVEGGDNIVSMFARWGLVIALAIFKLMGRMLVGATRPFWVKSLAPAAIGNFVALPILLVLFGALAARNDHNARCESGSMTVFREH
jgi:hypothetical protein